MLINVKKLTIVDITASISLTKTVFLWCCIIWMCLKGFLVNSWCLSHTWQDQWTTIYWGKMPEISACVFSLVPKLSIPSILILSNKIWASAWDFQQCDMCDQQSLRSACAVWSEPLIGAWVFHDRQATDWTPPGVSSLKGGDRSSHESTHVKIPYCSKSHALAHYRFWLFFMYNHKIKYIMLINVKMLYSFVPFLTGILFSTHWM